MGRRLAVGCVCSSLFVIAFSGALAAGNVDLPRFPSISPGGDQIVFSWRGDLWKVAASGGQATRLTSHTGNDTVSAWSPGGRHIAFNSDRSGSNGIYLMNSDGTDIHAVTDIDRSCSLAAFGADADGTPIITFHSTLNADNYRSPRPFKIAPAGGDLLRVHDAFGSHPVPSPDGSQVAFTRGGANWRRRHYRGPDQRNVWVFEPATGRFTQVTDWTGNDGMARWEDGSTLLYASDRELKRVNLYRQPIGAGSPERLTDFRDRDIQHLDVAADGSRAVMMAWDTLYTLDLRRKGARPVALQIQASEDERDLYKIHSIDKEVSEAALSPDGKVMAYVAYGDVYVRNLDDKSPTRPVTTGEAREKHIAWSPDGVTLYYVSDRRGTDSIYAATVATTRGEVKEEFERVVDPRPEKDGADDGNENGDGDQEEDGDDTGDDDADEELPKELQPDRWHDALTFNLAPVIAEAENATAPSPSPDGKRLAYQSGRGDLLVKDVKDLEGKKPARELVTGWDTGIHWNWSPDSRHIAYSQADMDFNRDIWIRPADGSSEAVNITRHPDNEISPVWSADGRILSFLSERVDEEYDVWMVYLDPEIETYTPKELEDYYKKAAEAAGKRKPLNASKDDKDKKKGSKAKKKGDKNGKKDGKGKREKKDAKEPEPVALSLDDAYLRLRRVTRLPDSEFDLALTPGGDRYIFTATIGDRGLYSVKWDGKDRKKLAGNVDVHGISLDGKKVVIVSGGRAGTVPPDGDKLKYHEIEHKIRIDLEKQSSQKFLEAARILGERFYHPTMKGLDWPELTWRYHELARKARTANEFNEVANRFIGELNASHLGITARDEPSPNRLTQGRLGTVHARTEDGFKVLRVIPESPAAKGTMALKPGDVITAIRQKAFGATDTVESMLAGRVGEETLLTIRRQVDGDPRTLDVLITPISWGAERQLRYRDWRRDNARRVEEASDGRIGYIHIQAMNQSSLDVFERDLYAAAADKDGLIIDVRNNGGGWTTDRLLASIMVQPHAYTIPRGADQNDKGHYPQDRLFIQRYSLPINMLCNEKSFSNAEIISHAFKTLGRGTLVGQETYGAVISTGGTRLIDGTFVRLPFRGWYLTDDEDMENHGAVPDIIVTQTPEAESKGADDQLRAAVDDLLKRL